MTHQDFIAVEHASRGAMVWSPERDESVSRYRALMVAAFPAAAILVVAATVLARLLAA